MDGVGKVGRICSGRTEVDALPDQKEYTASRANQEYQDSAKKTEPNDEQCSRCE